MDKIYLVVVRAIKSNPTVKHIPEMRVSAGFILVESNADDTVKRSKAQRLALTTFGPHLGYYAQAADIIKEVTPAEILGLLRKSGYISTEVASTLLASFPVQDNHEEENAQD